MTKSAFVMSLILSTVGCAAMVMSTIKKDVDLSILGMLTLIYAKQFPEGKE